MALAIATDLTWYSTMARTHAERHNLDEQVQAGFDLVQHDIKGALLLQRPAKVNRHKANPMSSSQGQQPS